jgi:GWxTD domain-containing protein
LKVVFLQIVVLLFAAFGVYADNIDRSLPLKSGGGVSFTADVYQFEYSDSGNILEICYSLNLKQLTSPENKSGKIQFDLDLNLFDADNRSIASIHDVKIPVSGLSDSSENALYVDIKKFLIAVDSLKLSISIRDSLSGEKGNISANIRRMDYSSRLSISSPVFVSSLYRTSSSDIFYRGGIGVLPNVSRVYSVSPDANNQMLIYYEINNLKRAGGGESSYSLFYTITDINGHEVKSKELHGLNSKESDLSRIEKIDIDSLASGIYLFSIRVRDLYDERAAEVSRYFYVYSSDLRNMNATVLPMGEDDIKKYYEQIQYIATKRELKTFKMLDPLGKQQFLLQFWKDRDPDPSTPENEFMIEHFRRMAYCKDNFRKGVNGDRGRVYIMYGPPVNIERHASYMGNSKAVEIWEYNIEGRVQFVFVDRTNDGNYVLMHSTHSDEITNRNWVNELK